MYNFLPMSFSDRRWLRQYDMVNRMFDDLNQSMRCDVQDLGDRFELKIDVPGVKKEDIQLNVTDDVLSVKVETRTDSGSDSPEITAEKADGSDSAQSNETLPSDKRASTEVSNRQHPFIHRERSYSSMERRFDVSEIVSDKITAAYENGVLTLVLPKKNPTAPEKNVHTINID